MREGDLHNPCDWAEIDSGEAATNRHATGKADGLYIIMNTDDYLQQAAEELFRVNVGNDVAWEDGKHHDKALALRQAKAMLVFFRTTEEGKLRILDLMEQVKYRKADLKAAQSAHEACGKALEFERSFFVSGICICGVVILGLVTYIMLNIT